MNTLYPTGTLPRAAMLAAIIAATSVCAVCPTTQFACAKAVLPPDAASTIASLTLDTDIFTAAQADFRDIRLIDQSGVEVPCRIVRSMIVGERIQRVSQPLTLISAAPSGDSFVVLFELRGDAPAVDTLSLATPLKDFERSVDVLGSDNGTTWSPITENAVVFDYTRFMDVHNHDVKLPRRVSFRYLKLVVHDVSEDVASSLRTVSKETRAGAATAEKETQTVERRAFRIDAVNAWRNIPVRGTETGETAEYPILSWSATNDMKNQTTIIEFTMPRVPLTSLALDASSVNFSRAIELQAPAPENAPLGTPAWRTVQRTTISRIKIGAYQHEQMKIEFPEQRGEKYRLVIGNHDNPPIDITGVCASGNVYRVQFLPEKGKQYTLYYGADNMVAPHYDLAALMAGLSTGVRPTAWTLGPHTRLTPVPTSTGLAWLNSRITLTVAIVAMVILLAWGIWHTSKKIGSTVK